MSSFVARLFRPRSIAAEERVRKLSGGPREPFGSFRLTETSAAWNQHGRHSLLSKARWSCFLPSIHIGLRVSDLEKNGHRLILQLVRIIRLLRREGGDEADAGSFEDPQP